MGLISQNILNLSAPQANALSSNGWESMSDFIGFSTKDIQNWIDSLARRGRGPINIPQVRSRGIFATAYWVNRKNLRGDPIVAADFTAAELRTALLDYPIYDREIEADDTADKPDLFKYEKWIDWQDSVITFLKSTRNVNKNVPLFYVIRKEPRPASLLPTEENDIIYNAPLQGRAFAVDNKAVHTYLTELTNGTDADQWIKHHKRSQNGRQAWIDLCNHYDGPAEGDKRVTVARSDINSAHYKNESAFTFEKYSTVLRKAFSTLETYNQPKCEKEKVEILLNQINTSDTRLISTIAICRDQHSRTFDDACTYMSQQIAVIYPQLQPSAFGRGKITRNSTNRRNINSTIIRKGGKITCKGVDLTDTTRYFSPQEFSKIGPEGRKYLKEDKKRKAYKESRAKDRDSKKVKVAATSADAQNAQVAAIINGVMNASRAGNAFAGQSPAIQPQHGPHARNASQVQQQQQSQDQGPIFDHLGNIIQK